MGRRRQRRRRQRRRVGTVAGRVRLAATTPSPRLRSPGSQSAPLRACSPPPTLQVLASLNVAKLRTLPSSLRSSSLRGMAAAARGASRFSGGGSERRAVEVRGRLWTGLDDAGERPGAAGIGDRGPGARRRSTNAPPAQHVGSQTLPPLPFTRKKARLRQQARPRSARRPGAYLPRTAPAAWRQDGPEAAEPRQQRHGERPGRRGERAGHPALQVRRRRRRRQPSPPLLPRLFAEIGSATCRESLRQYVGKSGAGRGIS